VKKVGVFRKLSLLLVLILSSLLASHDVSRGETKPPQWQPDILITLVVTQDYGEAKNFNGLPVWELVEKIAGYFELDTFPYNEGDALFKVEVKGKPLSAKYADEAAGGDASGKRRSFHRYYTGAELLIKLSFEPMNGKGMRYKISEKEPPAQSIDVYGAQPPTSPSDAPFNAAYSFCEPELARAVFTTFYRFLKGHGEAGEAHAIRSMVVALADENPSVCEAAKKTLRDIDPGWAKRAEAKEAVEPLIARLADENWFVRKSAAEALGEIGDERAAGPLANRLTDEEQFVRQAAAEALGKMGHKVASGPTMPSAGKEEFVDLEVLMSSESELPAVKKPVQQAAAGPIAPPILPEKEETVDLEGLMAVAPKESSKEDAAEEKRTVEKAALPAPSEKVYIDKKAIRDTFQKSYIGRVRLCYSQGLERDPTLAGNVVIRFTIGLEGNVIAAEVANSTLPDKKVVECIRRRFLIMKFPAPEGAPVTVNYSFSFKP